MTGVQTCALPIYHTSAEDDEPPEFQLAPMIDVVFQLLVFFVIAAKIEQVREAGHLELPIAAHSEKADEKDRSIIDLKPVDDTHYENMVNAQVMSPEQLTAFLEKFSKTNPSYRVILRADRELRYRFVQNVMEACSRAGISKVAFASTTESAAPKNKAVQ